MTHIEITFHLREGLYVFASDDKAIFIEGQDKDEVSARFMPLLVELTRKGISCRIEAYAPLGKTLILIRATNAICRVGLKDPWKPELPKQQMPRRLVIPLVDFCEPLPRILAFDPTPAGLITAPLRTAFKYLWKRLREDRFASGDFSCEICDAVESQARLIHAHEVYSFPDSQIVQLDRVIFICYRCHDTIHLERTRCRAKEAYLYQLENHYCRVNGGLSRHELDRDYSTTFQTMLSIREFYNHSQPRLCYGPFQHRVEEVLAVRNQKKRTSNKWEWNAP